MYYDNAMAKKKTCLNVVDAIRPIITEIKSVSL